MNNKYKTLLIVIVILAIIAIGYLSYVRYQESKLGPVSYESFKRAEENGKTFLENKEVGLKFEVPEGWKTNYVFGWTSLSMQSEDFKVFNEKNYPIPEKGCWINVVAEKQYLGKEDAEYLDAIELINDSEYLSSQNTDNNKYEVYYLDSIESIKSNILIDQNKDNQGNYISVEVPYNNIYYSFETHLFGQDKEKCQEEFNNFLKTISIKKK
ncbi:MAG: hypothetical protein PHD31_02065 [Candidatus Pacebacteria bacterium]|nr:hypothetical protein [Candidatus Paceibacterota bacterium]